MLQVSHANRRHLILQVTRRRLEMRDVPRVERRVDGCAVVVEKAERSGCAALYEPVDLDRRRGP